MKHVVNMKHVVLSCILILLCGTFGVCCYEITKRTQPGDVVVFTCHNSHFIGKSVLLKVANNKVDDSHNVANNTNVINYNYGIDKVSRILPGIYLKDYQSTSNNNSFAYATTPITDWHLENYYICCISAKQPHCYSEIRIEVINDYDDVPQLSTLGNAMFSVRYDPTKTYVATCNNTYKFVAISKTERKNANVLYLTPHNYDYFHRFVANITKTHDHLKITFATITVDHTYFTFVCYGPNEKIVKSIEFDDDNVQAEHPTVQVEDPTVQIKDPAVQRNAKHNEVHSKNTTVQRKAENNHVQIENPTVQIENPTVQRKAKHNEVQIENPTVQRKAENNHLHKKKNSSAHIQCTWLLINISVLVNLLLL